MDLKTNVDEVNRKVVHTLEYTQREMLNSLDIHSLVSETRTRLAMAIVEQVMAKVSPAIDRAIRDSFKD